MTNLLTHGQNLETQQDAFDLNTLLHPASAFSSPSDVLSDPDLTRNEKRAILASWASDACAVEAAPGLRKTAGGRLVCFDEVMEALRALDGGSPGDDCTTRFRKAVRRRAVFGRARGGSPAPITHPV